MTDDITDTTLDLRDDEAVEMGTTTPAEAVAYLGWTLREAHDVEMAINALQSRQQADLDRLDRFYRPEAERLLAAQRRLAVRVAEQATHARALGAFGRKKSLATPYGVATYRKRQERIAVQDAAACLAWTKANHPALVHREEKIVESVPRADLLAQFKTDGVVPDGCEFQPEGETFSFTMAHDEPNDA